jgi:divalent metal cation (Fe/Co/Zn/Cd) transporter
VLLAAQILLIIAGVLLLYDAWLMITHRPNPLKGMPLPCPVTLTVLGLGVILFSIASF